MISETIFKAYDIRGRYPEEIDEAAVKRIAQAYAHFVHPKKVAVGRDVRLSSPSLQHAVIEGLQEAGVDVVDIGMGPTELSYFTVGNLGIDGGIQVSASHNPKEYNGLKMIRQGVEAISSDTGLQEIKDLAFSDKQLASTQKGTVEQLNVQERYIDFLAHYVNLFDLPPLKIVANNNCGASGPIAKRALEKINLSQLELIELNFQPDGNFPLPEGRPDPLIPANRESTIKVVKENQADLAVAWDADGDRCYLCDETGQFIEGCHLTALLAEHLLKTHPGEKIIYDPRNVWAVEQTVKAAGGEALLNKAGHTFIKNRMKKENALFAGEMSGHFYFRDFYGADNGIMPFLLFLQIMAQTKKKASQIVEPLREKYFVSGEINFRVNDISAAMAAIREKAKAGEFDETDGLSVSFGDWRFNLRPSNTEPLLRLNIEAGSAADCQRHKEKLTELLEPFLAN